VGREGRKKILRKSFRLGGMKGSLWGKSAVPPGVKEKKTQTSSAKMRGKDFNGGLVKKT